MKASHFLIVLKEERSKPILLLFPQLFLFTFGYQVCTTPVEVKNIFKQKPGLISVFDDCFDSVISQEAFRETLIGFKFFLSFLSGV